MLNRHQKHPPATKHQPQRPPHLKIKRRYPEGRSQGRATNSPPRRHSPPKGRAVGKGVVLKERSGRTELEHYACAKLNAECSSRLISNANTSSQMFHLLGICSRALKQQRDRARPKTQDPPTPDRPREGTAWQGNGFGGTSSPPPSPAAQGRPRRGFRGYPTPLEPFGIPRPLHGPLNGY